MHSIKMQDTPDPLERNSPRTYERSNEKYEHLQTLSTSWRRNRRARRRTTSGARVLSCLPAFWISSPRDSDEARGRWWWCCPSYRRLSPPSRTSAVWSRSPAASGSLLAFSAFWACSTFLCPPSYRSRTPSTSSMTPKRSLSTVEQKSLPFGGLSSTFPCSRSLVYWIPACLKRENCLYWLQSVTITSA